MAQGPVQHGAHGPGTRPNSTPPVPGSFVLGKYCNLLIRISAECEVGLQSHKPTASTLFFHKGKSQPGGTHQLRQ